MAIQGGDGGMGMGGQVVQGAGGMVLVDPLFQRILVRTSPLLYTRPCSASGSDLIRVSREASLAADWCQVQA